MTGRSTRSYAHSKGQKMKLSELIEGLDYKGINANIDSEITQIAYDSRRVVPGAIFVAISGFKTDGHLYVDAAIKAGAVAVVVEKKVAIPTGLALLEVSDSRQALAVLAASFYGYASKNLNVIAVTGTNGKTTTTHLIKAIHEQAGWETAIMGTLYAQAGGHNLDLGHTTPESPEVQAFMALCREQGIRHLVMEVSSHALDLNRVDQVHFNAGIFTNLTQDHLDYHGTMEDYLQAKLRLFHQIVPAVNNFCVINQDDPHAARFIQAAPGRYITYGINSPAQVQALDVKMDLNGSQFTVSYGKDMFKIKTQLIGLFSVYNALAAIAFALGEGIAEQIIINAMQEVSGVPGRFERIASDRDFAVVVDYAHTPDGLENILKTARQLSENRLITVFGCGGDRDRGKRPLMGEIAVRYSDFSIVTSDNPRSEEPQAIIDNIVAGMGELADSRYTAIIDRAQAIRQAINLARKGDLIVIAGKGHENYQIVKEKRLDFDDRVVARRFLNEIQ